MHAQVYFEDIKSVILQELAQAQQSIVVAVAWFTEPQLFTALCRQAAKGRQVRLALMDNEENTGSAYSLNFQKLRDLGGQVHLLPTGADGRTMMHQKFCVIDGQTVLSGSFNWTRQASKNSENIQVLREAEEMAAHYLQQFEEILASFLGEQAPPPDLQKLTKRLQALIALLELEDVESAAAQLKNLEPLLRYLPQLRPALSAIRAGHVDEAAALLRRFLADGAALTRWHDPALEMLKLELLCLESEIAALDTRRTESEALLRDFSRVELLHMGEAIARYLDLQRRLASCRLQRRLRGLDPDEDLDEEDLAAEEARRKEQQKAYNKARADQEAEEPPAELNDEEQAELKKLFRAAAPLCHPDKIPDKDKARAEEVFKELGEAYGKKNLRRVRELAERLKKGLFHVDDKSQLPQDRAVLEAKLAWLRQRRDKINEQLHGLFSSKAWALLQQAGADWTAFFQERGQALQAEISALETDLAELESEL